MSESKTPKEIEAAGRDFHPRESIPEHLFRLQQEIGTVVAELCHHERWWKKALHFLDFPALPTGLLVGTLRHIANFEGQAMEALFGRKYEPLQSFSEKRKSRIQELVEQLVNLLRNYHQLLEKIPVGERENYLQQLRQAVAMHDKQAAKIFEKVLSTKKSP